MSSFRTPRSVFQISRRDWLAGAAVGVGAGSMSGWLAPFAVGAAKDPARKKSVIVLWMNGGPATIDMWDLKPGHANGGPFREVDTTAPRAPHLRAHATARDAGQGTRRRPVGHQ